MRVSGMGLRYGFVALVPVVLALGACESSSRLGSLLPDTGYRSAPAPQAAPAPLTPAPSSTVESSSLPPPPGASSAPIDPLPSAPQGGVATAPGAPGLGTPQTGLDPQSGLNPPAAPRAPAAPQVATAPAPVAAPNRTSLVGNWSVAESSGSKCRITLSSAPKLDLYGAGTSGCQTKELQRVNAWELTGSEVILYEPGGGVVARLRQSGAQSYNGATAKSGAPVSLSK
jgi:hypothetical protein